MELKKLRTMHLKKVKLACIGHPFPAVRVRKNKTVRQKFCSESCVDTQRKSLKIIGRYVELFLISLSAAMMSCGCHTGGEKKTEKRV